MCSKTDIYVQLLNAFITFHDRRNANDDRIWFDRAGIKVRV